MKAISNNEIAKAIYLSTKDKSGSHLKEAMENVLKFLSRKRLLSKSKEILEILKRIINQEEGIMVAKITSSSKLDHKTQENLKQALKKRYKAKEVVLEEKLNEKILGGVKIEVNDEVIDLTLKNKIGQLQRYLTRNV